MASGNFFRDNEDLLFQFKHGLRWEELVGLVESGYTLPDGPRSLAEAQGLYDELLSAIGEFSAREIAPRAAAIDRKGTHLADGEVVFSEELDAIFGQMKEMGLHALTLPRRFGGSNAPMALYFIACEVMARADVSVMSHFGFHGGIANAMLLYSLKEGSARVEGGQVVQSRWDKEIAEIGRGEAFGCMVLTEPGAGSDLGAVRTRAELGKDGAWRLNGEKIFITSGHGQYEFVLARTEAGSEEGLDGLKGLSLFFVRRKLERGGKLVDNVKVTKVEEKLGHHGSATCSLLYEDSVGELVGERGQGFELMLLLMNSARIGVGFEAIGNAEAALRMAQSYAAERRTMGRPIAQHELIAEKLLDMETWVAGMRALAFEAVNAVELSNRLEIQLRHEPPAGEEARAALKSRHQRLSRKARRLTPLLKFIASEKSVEIARNAMQIYGGMGYIDEAGVHKLLRDALVMPVYEGTTQIQALMATKDHLLWAARDPAGFMRRGARARLLARTANDELTREVYRAETMVQAATETIMLRIFGQKVKAEWSSGLRGKAASDWGRYLTRTFLRRWDVKADFAQGLLHAERLARMLTEVAIGKVLAKQAERFPERRALARRFLHGALLRVEALAKEIEHSDDSVFEAIAAQQEKAKSA